MSFPQPINAPIVYGSSSPADTPIASASLLVRLRNLYASCAATALGSLVAQEVLGIRAVRRRLGRCTDRPCQQSLSMRLRVCVLALVISIASPRRLDTVSHPTSVFCHLPSASSSAPAPVRCANWGRAGLRAQGRSPSAVAEVLAQWLEVHRR